MTVEFFEVLENTRAMRRLKPDPVPEELLQKLIYYATRAPSSANTQLWGFLMLTDREDIGFIAKHVQERWTPYEIPEDANDPETRWMRAVLYLVEHLAEVPAMILPCIDNAYPDRENPIERSQWATIYPATQNLLLSARALGLGATMTTFHRYAEREVRDRFGIPDNVGIGSTVVLGYPMGRFGGVTRKPVEQVTHWGRWGNMRDT